MKLFDKYFKEVNNFQDPDNISFDKQVRLWLSGFIKITLVLGILGIGLSEGYLLIYSNITGHNIQKEIKEKENKLEYVR